MRKIQILELERSLNSLQCDCKILKSEAKYSREPSHKMPLDSAAIILQRIERNLKASKEIIPVMSKVFVIGTPYRKPFRTDLTIYAFDMQRDAGPNRDKEINFKNHLFDLYENIYLKADKPKVLQINRKA